MCSSQEYQLDTNQTSDKQQVDKHENIGLRTEVSRLHEACAKLQEENAAMRDSFKELTGKDPGVLLAEKKASGTGRDPKVAAEAAIKAAHESAVAVVSAKKAQHSSRRGGGGSGGESGNSGGRKKS